MLENYDTGKTDQRDYLQISLDIRNKIQLTDGNRHFLFPLILSVFAFYLGWLNILYPVMSALILAGTLFVMRFKER